MEKFEKVEMLREKAGVSFEEAKAAMEACNYDMLDAMIYLEKQGKVNTGSTASYTTSNDTDTSQEFEEAQKEYEDSCQRTSVGELIHKFGKWCSSMIQKLVEIDFCVVKNDKMILKVPAMALILGLVLMFWFVAILLVAGLFCDCRYFFQGVQNETINQICDQAAETCQNIKKDFQSK